MTITDEELGDLSQAHVAYTNTRGEIECAAMSDDACAYSDARAWPCRTRRLLDELERLRSVAESCCASCEDTQGHRVTDGYLSFGQTVDD